MNDEGQEFQLDPNWRVKPMLRVDETAAITTLGITACYNAIKRGDLPSRKIGGRIVVPTIELRRWLGETVDTQKELR